ncbi:hypothetical protein ALC53_00670 [Atta colombica]|uniref:Uncharacterized protein n=1 Tax=Atta colombica TaxID=520822 RepID=A0A195BXR2_9HYME|nr:hypothetical protein ALC53_00670 [Atta colombica]
MGKDPDCFDVMHSRVSECTSIAEGIAVGGVRRKTAGYTVCCPLLADLYETLLTPKHTSSSFGQEQMNSRGFIERCVTRKLWTRSRSQDAAAKYQSHYAPYYPRLHSAFEGCLPDEASRYRNELDLGADRKAVEQSLDEIATESPKAPLLCSPGIIVALKMASATVVSAWSENVENFGGLSAGFNAQRSVSTGSHGIITKSPKPHL